MSTLNKNDKLEMMKMLLEVGEALISSVSPEEWTEDGKKEADAFVKDTKAAIAKESTK